MRFLLSTVRGLPVVTVSGEKLGKVSDIQCDETAWNIVALHVHAGMFTKENLLIAPSQIVRVEQSQVVVADAVLTELNEEKKSAQGVPGASPAV